MIKRIRTGLRNVIQPIAKRLNGLLLKLFPETRCWFVRSINKVEWLSNGLRRCTGKTLLDQRINNEAPGNILCALSSDMKRPIKKVFKFFYTVVLRYPKLKPFCLSILVYCPPLKKRIIALLARETSTNVYFVLPSSVSELSPRGKDIYIRLCELQKDKG